MTTKEERACQICGKMTMNRFIGGPVSIICDECIHIVDEYRIYKNYQHQLWLSANSVNLDHMREHVRKNITDEYSDLRMYLLGIIDDAEEIQLRIAQQMRAVYNMAIDGRTKVSK